MSLDAEVGEMGPDRLAMALDHPLRRELLRRLDNGEELSPKKLTAIIATRSLSNVAYHVRVLANRGGAIDPSRCYSSEGSTEHVYVSRVSDNREIAAILKKTKAKDRASLG